jgi:hypothetical protein
VLESWEPTVVVRVSRTGNEKPRAGAGDITRGAFHMSQVAFRHMLERGTGRIDGVAGGVVAPREREHWQVAAVGEQLEPAQLGDLAGQLESTPFS